MLFIVSIYCSCKIFPNTIAAAAATTGKFESFCRLVQAKATISHCLLTFQIMPIAWTLVIQCSSTESFWSISSTFIRHMCRGGNKRVNEEPLMAMAYQEEKRKTENKETLICGSLLKIIGWTL